MNPMRWDKNWMYEYLTIDEITSHCKRAPSTFPYTVFINFSVKGSVGLVVVQRASKLIDHSTRETNY